MEGFKIDPVAYQCRHKDGPRDSLWFGIDKNTAHVMEAGNTFDVRRLYTEEDVIKFVKYAISHPEACLQIVPDPA